MKINRSTKGENCENYDGHYALWTWTSIYKVVMQEAIFFQMKRSEKEL